MAAEMVLLMVVQTVDRYLVELMADWMADMKVQRGAYERGLRRVDHWVDRQVVPMDM